MAQPFRFRLDSLLTYRKQLEEQAALAMAEAQQRHDRQVELVERLAAELAAAEAEHFAKPAPSSAEHWLWQGYQRAAQQDIASAQADLEAMAEELQTLRDVLQQRSKDRKLLEKLKETEAHRHAKEDMLAEQKEDDETATLRFQHPHF